MTILVDISSYDNDDNNRSKGKYNDTLQFLITVILEEVIRLKGVFLHPWHVTCTV